MATSAADRLRRDVGATASTLSDDDATDLFDEAGETYTDTATAAAYARVLAIQGILASSAKLTSYKQNESSEELSDVFKHLKDLLKLWEDKVSDAIAATGSGAVRFGRVRLKPARIREYPGE